MCKTVQSSGPRVPRGDDKGSEWERTYRRISRSGTKWMGRVIRCRVPLPNTTVVDRRETELLPAFDSGMSWRGIDDVFASGTNAAGAQCRATRAIAMRWAGGAVRVR